MPKLEESSFRNSRVPIRIGSCPALFPFLAGRLIAPVEAISRGYFCAGSRKRRSSPLKSLLIIAAVLAGDPAATDPRLELLTRLFDSQADCERVKTESTGEGEIEGKKVLRIVGRCQELTPEEVQPAQGRTPALRMIERARTGYVVATKLKGFCLRKVDMSYGLRLIRPRCLAWATSGGLCRV